MARSDMTVELKLKDEDKMLIAEAREQLELNDKERAVIEAAKAWRKRYHRGIRFCNGDQAFAEAIDALREVEGE